jgi:hypothetical protein
MKISNDIIAEALSLQIDIYKDTEENKIILCWDENNMPDNGTLDDCIVYDIVEDGILKFRYHYQMLEDDNYDLTEELPLYINSQSELRALIHFIKGDLLR